MIVDRSKPSISVSKNEFLDENSWLRFCAFVGTNLCFVCGAFCIVLGCLLVKFRPQAFMMNYVSVFVINLLTNYHNLDRNKSSYTWHFESYVNARFQIFSFHRGGEMYNWWLNSSAANVLLKAYAFNITNPEEFMAGREKMKLQEVGPFVYR